MTVQETLTKHIQVAVQNLFDLQIEKVEFQATRREFEGDITMVVFPLVKLLKGNPLEIGNKIGNYLVENVAEVEKFNVVAGFLNIVISDAFYVNFFNSIKDQETFGYASPVEGEKAIMVEYSSPNTNKPLHLGHIRNNLLGYSVAEIIKASGKKVYKTQIINDRGIHICKSMLAWQKFGNGQTPESTGLKGDKLVGNFYVEFDKQYKKEINDLIAQGKTEDEAKKLAPSILEAQEMLRKWEAGDEEVVALWKKMNQWVYDGFEETYKNLGVDFDSYYYESNTYLLGKEVVQFGLEKGIFEKDPDGSVWIDLTEDGLDRKIVLRSDGTAVYMTQDIGTAIQRVKDNPDVGGMVYTVGNEQDYHFKVLFLILKKLGFDWAEHLYHLSYGMVELPSGKMKSREGTVVDADDLMSEMTETAQRISEELGKLDGYSTDEKTKLFKTIGLGALKYYMLKVDPKKTMMFNPEESVDFNGNTGPFIQYTYARIQSILRKADFDYTSVTLSGVEMSLHEKEKELIKQVQLFPEVIQNAAANYSPALIANYTYDLVKEFNSFYQNVSILGETDMDKKIFRVQLSKMVGLTIKNAFRLLGIQVPERM
ncbi:arginine--tRNA ligase [Flavobacterium okayamense]|uniref:Arginine--tRNA ligase n=1 Tax=Flavobacterium okayamense TaxID=2830782 RepID=A0ABM7S897_9FLAO|nr:arginine--tRNA ligase [Flavobacterium okayamense]BCY27183.1 arginine--tRNA ligase [Flavobacterium okayamense]